MDFVLAGSRGSANFHNIVASEQLTIRHNITITVWSWPGSENSGTSHRLRAIKHASTSSLTCSRVVDFLQKWARHVSVYAGLRLVVTSTADHVFTAHEI
jgi:hypothetical protein